MKTVLTLDEEAADILRAHAERRGVSLGVAASELIRIGARHRVVKPLPGAKKAPTPAAPRRT